MNIKKSIRELKHGSLVGEREHLIANTGIFVGLVIGTCGGVICTLVVWFITASL